MSVTLPLWFVVGLGICVALHLLLSVIAVRRLDHTRKLLAAESARLDWLDTRCGPVVVNQTMFDPYGEHIANEWSVEWPAATVREAIDEHMRACSPQSSVA